MSQTPVLRVVGLRTQFPTRHGLVKAVDGLDFEVYPGEILGIVGESGSGKSVTALSILRLLQPPGRIVSGQIWFNGRDLARLSEHEMRKVRGAEIAMIFQDPMTSLNPVFRIGWQVAEPLRLHRRLGLRDAMSQVSKTLGRVGIPEPNRQVARFPHEFSGGMRQRAMIAMGVSTGPSLLIADEPTTALDVTIQAQILDLLKEVNREYGAATLLITHNLGVVAETCDRMLVMFAGKIVEHGLTKDVFARPRHPYTWSLLRALPRIDAARVPELRAIHGTPPDLAHVPPGCSFHPRCPFVISRCAVDEPLLLAVASSQEARCWVTQAGKDLDSEA